MPKTIKSTEAQGETMTSAGLNHLHYLTRIVTKPIFIHFVFPQQRKVKGPTTALTQPKAAHSSECSQVAGANRERSESYVQPKLG